jgi:hypothetical protein
MQGASELDQEVGGDRKKAQTAHLGGRQGLDECGLGLAALAARDGRQQTGVTASRD